MSVITILLAYTSVVLTIVAGILGFVLYHFIPVKSKVETMWTELYGVGNVDGHIHSSEQNRESIREMIQETQAQHEELDDKMSSVIHYLDEFGKQFDDKPHLIEDDYVDDND